MKGLLRMKINSICIPQVTSLLEKIRKNLASKPSKQYPRMALRSPLEGLFVLSGCGLPLVLYKWGNYERKRSVNYPIRTY